MTAIETAASHIQRSRSCCLTTSCEEGRCSIKLPANGRDTACINGSEYQAHHGHHSRLADCIVFWSPAGAREILAPVELKGGRVKAGTALTQLQNAARLAQDLLGTKCQQIRFRPLLVHRGSVHTNEIRLLRSRPIVFRKKRVLASPVRSGMSFARAVS